MLLAESLLGTSSTAANYIEDVFSTYLYTGTGANQTISNGVDLSTYGGMVWIKSRSTAANGGIFDTARGANKRIQTDGTGAQVTDTNGLNSYATNGFNLGTGANEGKTNTSGVSYASWTFRKQAKFFDVVTYTGNGINGTAIPHNLGSVPGCIIIKRTDTAGDWYVYHRSYNGGVNPEQYTTYLNLTNAVAGPGSYSQYQAPTSTAFYPGAAVNAVGGSATYVAYLFAHDAGGFGASGSDNVISCGSYTGNNTNLQSINLGYEPQFILIKSASIAATDWNILDNMRGVATGGVDAVLAANSSAAEASPFDRVDFTATGFNLKTSSALYNETGTYIYIAIRRGPMKTPTSGTSVYTGAYGDNNGVAPAFNAGFPVDLSIVGKSTDGSTLNRWTSRLLQATYLASPSTAAEAAASAFKFDFQSGFLNATTDYTSAFSWMFRRAPGFFDVVCYTGDGVAGRTVSHNLTVAPELMFVKSRSDGTSQYGWATYVQSLGNTKYLYLNTIDSEGVYTQWNNTSPTATNFTLGSYIQVNASGSNFVAYLFASCPGVSKVGSYTGTGTTKQIDCGFTGGARFVLIKRTDSTGDWYVWDSARGIVAGNDPYLRLNSTAAEVTNTDYIDTYSAGFEISSTAPAAINANGGSYIFMAVS